MVTTSTRVRLSAAAAAVLLLVGGAACSKDTAAPPAVGTSGPSAGGSGSPAASGAPSVGTSGGPSAGTSSGPSAGPSTAAPGPSTTPSSTLPPPATTAVPQPSAGSATETVPAKPEVTKKPVKLDKPSDAGGGVDVRITDVKAITAKAQLPGEVAGPAVRLTMTVQNGSAKAVDLSSVVVTLADSDDAPGIEMSASPADPFTGKLASGKTAKAVYVFTVGRTRRNPITVNVTLSGGAPVLLFTGNAT